MFAFKICFAVSLLAMSAESSYVVDTRVHTRGHVKAPEITAPKPLTTCSGAGCFWNTSFNMPLHKYAVFCCDNFTSATVNATQTVSSINNDKYRMHIAYSSKACPYPMNVHFQDQLPVSTTVVVKKDFSGNYNNTLSVANQTVGLRSYYPMLIVQCTNAFQDCQLINEAASMSGY